MIKTETIELNEKQFKRTYSEAYQIRKVGTNEIYSEAVDILTANYEYEETDLPLVEEETGLSLVEEEKL